MSNELAIVSIDEFLSGDSSFSKTSPDMSSRQGLKTPANFKANWLEGRAKIPTEKALASITLWGGLFFTAIAIFRWASGRGGG